MVNRYKNRYEKPRIPTAPSIPILKTVDAVLSHIAKHRTFVAPRLLWEDRASDGSLIQWEEYGIKGEQFAPQGIKKCYVLRDYTMKEQEANPDYVLPSLKNLYIPLFVYDYQTEQWYRNARPTYNTEEHPCHPSVTPDKAVIALPDNELRYLMRHGVMGLMEAKVQGRFRTFEHQIWSNKSGTWVEVDIAEWLEWEFPTNK